MRSIEKRFLLEHDKNPLSSTFINFSKTVEGQNFTEPVIRKWFNILVDKEDYDIRDKKQLVEFLIKLSNS